MWITNSNYGLTIGYGLSGLGSSINHQRFQSSTTPRKFCCSLALLRKYNSGLVLTVLYISGDIDFAKISLLVNISLLHNVFISRLRWAIRASLIGGLPPAGVLRDWAISFFKSKSNSTVVGLKYFRWLSSGESANQSAGSSFLSASNG